MAEVLMHEGRDVLIVYDDLSKHADAYRELSLLLRRPPGREAYPGDVFYLHARLLERACKLAPPTGEAHPLSPPTGETPPLSPPLRGMKGGAGGGSLTALPIVEMQRGNIAAYIPTNLISISDGQIVLDSDLFNRGVKPAVNVGQSVSRVGGAAQTAAMRAVAHHLRLELAQFEEVAHFARFGAEVDAATQRQIRRGERLRAVLRQPVHQPLSLAAQVVVLLAATEGVLDDVALEDVPAFESGLPDRFEAEHAGFYLQINRSGELSTEMREALAETMTNYRTAWLEGLALSSVEGRRGQ